VVLLSPYISRGSIDPALVGRAQHSSCALRHQLRSRAAADCEIDQHERDDDGAECEYAGEQALQRMVPEEARYRFESAASDASSVGVQRRDLRQRAAMIASRLTLPEINFVMSI
jgi:hypothetical protein